MVGTPFTQVVALLQLVPQLNGKLVLPGHSLDAEAQNPVEVQQQAQLGLVRQAGAHHLPNSR